MTAWHRGPWVAFDTETTGVRTDEARIVTATVVDYQPGKQPFVQSWLIAVDVDIPDEAAAIHGITTEHAREHGTAPREGIGEIVSVLSSWAGNGVPLIAYNAAFDLTILDREARRHGITPLDLAGVHVIDPFVIDKAIDRFRRGKRTLTATCEHYGVALDGAHDATADALGAARVAWALAERNPNLQIPLADLHAAQVAWKAEQAASLQDYFRRQGKDEHVSPAWPLAPYVKDAA